MARDPWKHLGLKQCDSVGRGDAELGRQTSGDGEKLGAAMPSSGRGCDTLFSDGMHQRLGRSALGAEIHQARKQHARVEEYAHGQRFRSSSMSAAMSMFGRAPALVVGR